MNRHLTGSLLLAAAVIVMAGVSFGQTVRVVNMIPTTASGETNHDSEPNLAVNPANPLQLVGTNRVSMNFSVT